ncbi:zinc finger protein 423-like [Elysia marginata]|uniref:Zinc finger protein 423-like n=1 Tax=Elysia marginata TaxID=1093978 RepID=A0AAV4FA79_9GAST|nr:zinc finger protein 423-like [Elysia marginata]
MGPTDPPKPREDSASPVVKKEKLSCDMCSEEFLSQEYLDTHIEQIHGTGSVLKANSIKCPLCIESFATTEDLCAHIVSHAPSAGTPTSSHTVSTEAMDSRAELVGQKTNGATIMSELLQDDAGLGNKKRGHSSNSSSKTKPVTGEALVCPYCLVDGFESLESLELHLTSVHSVKPTEVYTCNYCNAPYPNLYSLHDHMTVVHRSQHGLDITYPCSMCVQRFHSLDALAKHKGIVHAHTKSTGIDAAFCNRCNMTLPSPRYLEEHMATVHNIIMDKTARSSKRKGKRLSKKHGVKFGDSKNHASKTNGVATFSSPPKKHARLSQGLTVEEASVAMLLPQDQGLPVGVKHVPDHLQNRPLTESHSLMSSLLATSSALSESLTCNQCNATFHEPQNYAAHMALHSSNLLSLSFARSAAVASAIGSGAGEEGTEATNRTITETGRSDKGGQSMHEAIIASKQPVGYSAERGGTDGARSAQGRTSQGASDNDAHECFKCGARFGSEEQLEAHASLHYLCVSTEYGCSSCQKNFSKPDELQKHLMDIHAHHLYRCSLCKDIFDSKVNIQVHFAIKHSNECKLYKCLPCDIMFRSEMEWQVHVRVNHLHMSKPYRCLFCQESFTSEVELQCHLTSHSKQFRCPMCDQAFHIEYLLDQHMQNCHGDHKPEVSQSRSDSKSPRPAITPSYKNVTTKKERSDSPKVCLDLKDNPFSSSVLPSSSSSSSGSPRIILKSPSARSPSQRSATSPHNQQHLIPSPAPEKSPYASNTITSPLTYGPVPQVALTSPPAAVSAIWKNTEPLHTCNICDVKFCNLALLNLHKAQDHGVKQHVINTSPQATVTSSAPLQRPSSGVKLSSTVATSVFNGDSERLAIHAAGKPSSKADRDKLLLANQTILSVLTNPSPSSNDASLPTAPPLSLIAPHNVTTPLSCMFCSQTFKSNAEYNKHMKIHINSGNLTCSICDETFTSAAVLAEHKLTHCKIQQGNTCVVCRATLSNQEQFFLHAQEHGFDGSLVQCVICRQTLSSLTELQMHGRHHFQVRPAFFTCCVCLKSFESRENLVAKLNASGRTYYVCKPCYHGEAPLHTCSQCSEKFATAQLLEAHMQTHKQATYQCIKCQQSFSSEREIQLHVASHVLTEGTQHECRLCGSVFDSPARLQTHLIQHSFVGRDIVCHVCNKVFDSPQEIQVHALEHGAPYRKYGCSRCAHTFFFSAELDNHKLIYNHGTVAATKDNGAETGSVIGNSPVAGMSPSSSLFPPPGFSISASSLLSSPAALSMATLASFISSSSSLIKPAEEVVGSTSKRLPESFQFSPTGIILPSPTNSGLLASQLFSTASSGLHSSHDSLLAEQYPLSMSLPLPVASEPPLSPLSGPGTLQCPECGKHFSTGTALANHRKTHWKKDSNSIRCSMCPDTFSSATAMQEHFFAVHSDKGYNRKKKSFKCMMCEKECSTLSALQNHILSHRTGGSLPCPLCKRTFTSQRYLNLHMRVHKTDDNERSKERPASRSQGDRENSTEEDTQPSPAAAAVDTPRTLACPVCGDSFNSTWEIDEHLKTHEEVFTTLSEATSTPNGFDLSTKGETATNEDNKKSVS